MGMKVQSATNIKTGHKKTFKKKKFYVYKVKTAPTAIAAAGTGDWSSTGGNIGCFGAAATQKCLDGRLSWRCGEK